MIDLVLIASTVGEGSSWLAAQPAPPARVVIVTPRSPRAARGYTAAAVFMTPQAQQLPPDVLQRLVVETLPAVATSRARPIPRPSWPSPTTTQPWL